MLQMKSGTRSVHKNMDDVRYNCREASYTTNRNLALLEKIMGHKGRQHDTCIVCTVVCQKTCMWWAEATSNSEKSSP